jgi:hypothetical protein
VETPFQAAEQFFFGRQNGLKKVFNPAGKNPRNSAKSRLGEWYPH